jgi:hypothetical protein
MTGRNKPETGRRVCTKEEIAEVLDGFKEEQIVADIGRELWRRPSTIVLAQKRAEAPRGCGRPPL